MKKVFAQLITAFIILTLCACTGNPSITPTTQKAQSPTPTEAVHVHDYTKKITSEATCTTSGEAQFTCNCGDNYTEVIEKLDHSYTSATCIAPKTCSVCNQVEGSVTDHSWETATCTKPQTCAICGLTEGSILDHVWETATCTKPKTCTGCGQTEGTVTPHSYSSGECVNCGAKPPYSLSTLQEIKDDLDFTMEQILSAETNLANAKNASYSSTQSIYFNAAKSSISLLPSHLSLMAMYYPDVSLPSGNSLSTLLELTKSNISYASNTSYLSSFETYITNAKEYTQSMLDGINQLIAEQS